MVTGGLDHPLGFTDSYMRLSLVYLCGFKNIQKACKKSQSFDTGLFPASGSFTRSSFNPNSEVAVGVHWNFDHGYPWFHFGFRVCAAGFFDAAGKGLKGCHAGVG
jgi:hypothetical protein